MTGLPNRRSAVLHVLETTVIGWIKQIKVGVSNCDYSLHVETAIMNEANKDR